MLLTPAAISSASGRPWDFQFAYFPYSDQLRVRVDCTGLPKRAHLESIEISIRKQGSRRLLKRRVLNQINGHIVESMLPIPTFEGKAVISVRLRGRGIDRAPILKTFLRKSFRWENLGLGTSTKVFPPFKPIALEGRLLKTVLRQHQLGELGLLDQVIARGEPLLAGPVHFEVHSEAKDYPLQTHPLIVQKRAAHQVVTESSFTAGPLQGRLRSSWDVDGTVRYDVHLDTSSGRSIDTLRLAIPLQATLATMVHAIGDGIRNTISRSLPDGDGVVWTSRDVVSRHLPPGFCSYIFVGNPLRGLSFFAENDRGWSWDRKTPNLFLERRGNVLWLRVNLVNKSLVIDQPRRITFGLLAAPVKPRLPGWRHRWLTDHYNLLGTCINWLGGPGVACNHYPPGKDRYFWQMIAQGNISRLPRPDIQTCIQRGAPLIKPAGKRTWKRWVRHAWHNLRNRVGKKMIFYFNRATCSAIEEYQTFLNEWMLEDFPSRDSSSHNATIYLVPSPSYIDFALYWYSESFRHGRNQGIYWDNFFFKPSYNQVMTDAYQDRDGATIPATGLWSLRELVKRSFIMMNELGMPPITMAHMTSTSILPMLSFATVQYDWEWKYSQGDYQDRFSREYTSLVSNGELAGAWPVVLPDHGRLQRDAWTQRTYAGVALLHELIGSGAGSVWQSLYKPVLALIQQPGIRVFTYWGDHPQPITSSSPRVPLIVYCLPKKVAIVVLVSYANKLIDVILSIDRERLGLGRQLRVTNVETKEQYPLRGNKLKLAIRRHAVIGIRLSKVKP